jgi:hypothetical protein
VHGEESIPVANLTDSKIVSDAGEKGVVVGNSLHNVLIRSGQVDTVTDVVARTRKAIKHVYSWDDLEADEKVNIDRAKDAINELIDFIDGSPLVCKEIGIGPGWAGIDHVSDAIQVADFNSATTMGQSGDGQVFVAKQYLKSFSTTLRILVHETAHLYLVGEGHSNEFMHATEELWQGLMYMAVERGKYGLQRDGGEE